MTVRSSILHIMNRLSAALHFLLTYYYYLSPLFVSAGVVSRNSEPQPEAWPDRPGPGTGLLPGDGPAEGTRHPLQERVRQGNGWRTNQYRRHLRESLNRDC